MRLHRAGNRVELQVEDTGIGIDPAFLPHAFEAFRQADSTITRAHGGLGLGLAIVRYLVDLHAGTITAHNKDGERGAVFTLRLPLAASPAAGRSPPPPRHRRGRPMPDLRPDHDSASPVTKLPARAGGIGHSA